MRWISYQLQRLRRSFDTGSDVSSRVRWVLAHFKVMAYIWGTESPVKSELLPAPVPVWKRWKWKIISIQESLQRKYCHLQLWIAWFPVQVVFAGYCSWVVRVSHLTIQIILQKPWHWSSLSQVVHTWPRPMLNSGRIYNRLTCLTLMI